MTRPWIDSLTSLGDDELRDLLGQLPPDQVEALAYDWPCIARPEQLPPSGSWRVWLVDAGRGFGKTRTGAEWVRASVRECPLVNVIGATVDDARDVMIEGESGILAVCPSGERPTYKKSDRRLDWPNGARTLIFTADEPERLRGKQHMKLWADEVAAWRYPDAWDQAMFGLRLGSNPQAVVTTTPRPVKIVLDLLKREHADVVVTRGTTYANRANLAPAFFSDIINRYEGTRLGRQELLAELLEDVEGALWNRDRIDALRVDARPALRRIVVGVDPAATSSEGSNLTGIVVAGLGEDGHGYVLLDATCKKSPNGWASEVIRVYDLFDADRVIAETNQGGEMVEQTIRSVDRSVSYKGVHAKRGKRLRAEPVSALYEQGKVHHVGAFPDLEDQMCNYTGDGDDSPDRLDALVYALTELMVGPQKRQVSVAA